MSPEWSVTHPSGRTSDDLRRLLTSGVIHKRSGRRMSLIVFFRFGTFRLDTSEGHEYLPTNATSSAGRQSLEADLGEEPTLHVGRRFRCIHPPTFVGHFAS